MIRKDYSGADHCVGVGNDSAEARSRRSPARAISGPRAWTRRCSCQGCAMSVHGQIRQAGPLVGAAGPPLGMTGPKLKRAAFDAMQGREPAPRFAILNPLSLAMIVFRSEG